MSLVKKQVLLFLCLLFAFSNVAHSAGSLALEEAKAKIDPLIITTQDKFTYEIVSISEPCGNLIAVFLNGTYRDFPNVIFFKYDSNSNSYIRVYEALGLGIQDRSSGKTNLHNLGLGADMTISTVPNDFNSNSTRNLLTIGNKMGFDIVPYQDFNHMHGPNVEFYTIDKTKYLDFAVQLFGNAIEKIYKQSCLMFETPDISIGQFNYDYENGKFTVTCNTENDQIWTVTFDGIDNDNRFLRNKVIVVGKL